MTPRAIFFENVRKVVSKSFQALSSRSSEKMLKDRYDFTSRNGITQVLDNFGVESCDLLWVAAVVRATLALHFQFRVVS